MQITPTVIQHMNQHGFSPGLGFPSSLPRQVNKQEEWYATAGNH